MKHVEERFGQDANKEVLLMCIGITSGVGRLIFGRVADYVHGVNKVYLQVSARPLRKQTQVLWMSTLSNVYWFNQYGMTRHFYILHLLIGTNLCLYSKPLRFEVQLKLQSCMNCIFLSVDKKIISYYD